MRTSCRVRPSSFGCYFARTRRSLKKKEFGLLLGMRRAKRTNERSLRSVCRSVRRSAASFVARSGPASIDPKALRPREVCRSADDVNVVPLRSLRSLQGFTLELIRARRFFVRQATKDKRNSRRCELRLHNDPTSYSEISNSFHEV